MPSSLTGRTRSGLASYHCRAPSKLTTGQFAHPIDARANTFDRETLEVTDPATLSERAETLSFAPGGDDECLDALRWDAPDLVIVFGADRLSKEMYSVASLATPNLHAGDSEAYRGLDTLLWAIYHAELDRLIVTMHQVNDFLDGGRIVLQDELPIVKTTKIRHLRALRTMACTGLATLAIEGLRRLGRLPSRLPRDLGRYYSHMPGTLKSACERKFDRYVATL